MGRPVARSCASCGVMSTPGCSETQGVEFSIDYLFLKQFSQQTQLWACCSQHKTAAIELILKDMPFVSMEELKENRESRVAQQSQHVQATS